VDRGHPGPNVTPVRFALSNASCNLKDNSFIAITNRYGDRGQPCLIPLVARKFPYVSPLTLTEKQVEEMHACTSLIK
jgi:hypothetical protein